MPTKKKKKDVKFWFEEPKTGKVGKVVGPMRMPGQPSPMRINLKIKMPQMKQEGIPVKMMQTKGNLVVQAMLSGYKKSDITVRVTQKMLEICVRKSTKSVTQQKGMYSKEVSSGEISRTMSLPVPVDSKKTRSKFKDGILEITMPIKK